jgi:hypothetical protein
MMREKRGFVNDRDVFGIRMMESGGIDPPCNRGNDHCTIFLRIGIHAS